uniref:Polyprotein n=1 Tax=Oryza sativa subsp. japonica TaxID=39947 RepID=Q5W739_ORYSJ|nr:putative polyprotein [Oryza sativa Japonica Group]
MALKGQVRGWLMTQPPDSIHSWEDLCQQFITNFQGTYPRPGEEADLHAIQRKDDESLRSYIQRFCQNGVRHNCMLEKIASKEPKTIAEHFELADKVARKEEAWAWNSPGTGAAAAAAPEPASPPPPRGKRKPAHSDDEGHVLAADGPSWAPCKERATGNKPSSTTPPPRRSGARCTTPIGTDRHSLTDCSSVRNLAERYRKADEEKRQSQREGKAPATPASDRRGEANKKAPADDDDDSEDLEFQIPQGTVATRDGGFKAMRHELLAAIPTHEATWKARWSEVKLTFDQSDHPTVLAWGGKLALVISRTIHNIKMKCPLVNGGAGLSIISPAAFDALKSPGMKLQPYLPIIGVTPGHTPALVKFMAATHYAYLQIKMPGHSGPITVFGDVKVTLACAEQRADNLAAATKPQAPEPSTPRASKRRLASADELPVKEIPLGDDPSKTAKIGTIGYARGPQGGDRAPPRSAARCVTRPAESTAPSPGAASLHPRGGDAAPGIREVIHPEWLANPVVVSKANGKLRMCIDYTDLNKACPKDPFPLPRIDQIVDSTAGRNVEVYVDDLVVKTRHQDTLLQDLAETFDSLRSTCMKLNPEKCVFVAPGPEEPLLLYLAVTPHSVSAALVVERDEGDLRREPGYGKGPGVPLTSDGPSSPNSPMPEAPNPREGPEVPVGEREAPADGPEACRTDVARDPLGAPEHGRPELGCPNDKGRPHRKILHNREGTGRIVNWAIELAEFDLHFEPQHTIKSQVLADFNAEWTPADDSIPSHIPSLPGDGEDPNADIRTGHWVMHFDGSLNLQGAGTGVTLTSPSGDVLKHPRALQSGRGGYQHLYVAIDKFTKWPEAYPVVKINWHYALKFIRGITSRFGVPNRIITDNGTQFTSELFSDYYDDMGIKLCFASLAHPKSNGQVERANAEILKGLKTKTYNILKKHGYSWLEEQPAVLCANRTTPSHATGETPFSLVYGPEAVLCSELSLRLPHVALYDEANQDDLHSDDLDYLEERRRRAALCAARYQQSLRRYHQRHVRARSLQVSDLVLRRIQSCLGLSKLSPM